MKRRDGGDDKLLRIEVAGRSPRRLSKLKERRAILSACIRFARTLPHDQTPPAHLPEIKVASRRIS
jgi:hypothetical protein